MTDIIDVAAAAAAATCLSRQLLCVNVV